MAINIGSNFMYRGEKYLDDRLNSINSKNDLKNWSIPIPDGFEVFIDDYWYTYNSENEIDDELGKFRLRSIVQEFGENPNVSVSQKVLTNKFDEVNSNIGVANSSINKLIKKVFPLTIGDFSITPATGNREIGDKISNLSASWYIYYEGEESIKLNPSKNFFSMYLSTSSSSTQPLDRGFNIESDNKINWSLSSNTTLEVPGTISFNFTTIYNDNVLGESIVSTGNKTYSFLYRRFWLASSKSELNSTDISSTTSSDLNNGYTKSSTAFNCSGGSGKYPYFILPTDSVTGSGKRLPQFWVGGLQNTDLTSGTMNLNRNGINIEYTWIRLNNLQTSSNVRIEFK